MCIFVYTDDFSIAKLNEYDILDIDKIKFNVKHKSPGKDEFPGLFCIITLMPER